MKLFVFIFLQITAYQKNIDSLINQFKSRPETKYSTVSVSIRDNETGLEVYKKNNEASFAPASTLKLITTASALKILGPDFRYLSEVFLSGNIKNDTLFGNIEVYGNGNPTFGSKRFGFDTFQNIKDQLIKKNIKVIIGKVIIIENKESSNLQLNWPLGDVGNYYGAYPKDFNFNENIFTVSYKGSHKLGQPAFLQSIEPQITDTLYNRVLTAEHGSGDQVNFIHSTFSGPIVASGTVPLNSKNFEVKGSLIDPKSTFTNNLNMYFIKNGISILNQKIQNQSAKIILYQEYSPTLSELVKAINLKSVNFLADALYLTISDNSEKVRSDINQIYNDLYKTDSLKFDSFLINDGSGLSPSNTLNVSFFSSFLQNISNSDISENFNNSLPIWGKSGTVASFDKNNITKGNIKAKSGSVQGVRNYAGYFKKNGREYSFVIFTNGINDTARLFFREFIEKFMILMLDLNQ
jgi:D-alanyl-D-alanine carboxypeptidase/D-alanyl-D-alanine-endopeptidase (penicillin-binding protein 4)